MDEPGARSRRPVRRGAAGNLHDRYAGAWELSLPGAADAQGRERRRQRRLKRRRRDRYDDSMDDDHD